MAALKNEIFVKSMTPPADEPGIYRFESFWVSAHERLLRKAGVILHVRPQVFDLLLILLQNAGRVVSKPQLISAIWPRMHVTEGNLTQLVRELRDILGDDASNPRYVTTQSKHGYRFIAPVQIVSSARKSPRKPKLVPLTTHSSEASIVVAAISADGRYLAYADDLGLYVKSIESGETHMLPPFKCWQ